MRSLLSSMLVLATLLLAASMAMPQDTSQSHSGVDLHRRVEFTFVDTDIHEIIRHLVQLTGWSIFYDTAQVHGKVTIITPGTVFLQDALRLVHEVLAPHSHAIRVLVPHNPQALPLAAILAALAQPPASPDVVVWRNSNARGPYSRPYPCDPQTLTYPLSPYGVDVIIDQHK